VRRHLTGADITYARDVFADSVDYSKIEITRDSMMSTGAPKTLGNTIHLQSNWGGPIFQPGDSMELTDLGRELLIHEMTHVWQYQHGGLAYIGDSLWAQLKASLGSGSRNGAYDWYTAHSAGLPWRNGTRNSRPRPSSATTRRCGSPGPRHRPPRRETIAI